MTVAMQRDVTANADWANAAGFSPTRTIGRGASRIDLGRKRMSFLLILSSQTYQRVTTLAFIGGGTAPDKGCPISY